MAQHMGTVAWFNSAKGYGFLKAQGVPDVFCHFTSIQGEGYRSLQEGESVEFDVAEGKQGIEARNVMPLK